MCKFNCHENEGKHRGCGHTLQRSFAWPIMDIEEEIKMLEEYGKTLTKSLEKINRRLEALKSLKQQNFKPSNL